MISAVWFKKDLRVDDHGPLYEASLYGKVLPFYIFEPDYWMQPYASLRQWTFLKESILELDQRLKELGLSLFIMIGKDVEVFSELYHQFKFDRLFSHQETGPEWTYERDIRVKQWCDKSSIPWTEFRQNGVIRDLRERVGWSKQWKILMNEQVIPRPNHINCAGYPEKSAREVLLSLQHSKNKTFACQKGGSNRASVLLNSFLVSRSENYRSGMSSPYSGQHCCSRLSPHFSAGTLSLRQVWQATERFEDTIRNNGTYSRQLDSLKSFKSRLFWHCHFMQKLESDPKIEKIEMHRGYIGLREDATDQLKKFTRFRSGELGWPYVDACIRCLKHTGWLNFRCRAMIMAVSSYHLWIDWRQTANLIAGWFTDFEAGIHFAQVQMQSGTTGVNANRIYSPIKQSLKYDPHGVFIRKWIPELTSVSDEWIHTPWKMPHSIQLKSGCIIGKTYPEPIGDPFELAQIARKKIHRWNSIHNLGAESERVLIKHGSRKRPRSSMIRKKSDYRQMKLNFIKN